VRGVHQRDSRVQRPADLGAQGKSRQQPRSVVPQLRHRDQRPAGGRHRRAAPGQGQHRRPRRVLPGVRPERQSTNPRPAIQGNKDGSQGKVTSESVNKNDVLSYRRVPGVGETAGQQEAYNKALDVSNAALKLQVDQAQKAVGLSGEQLLAEQRRQVIETAIATAERSAQEKGLTLDDARKKAIAELIGKQFDLAHAQEEATVGVTQAQAERQALLDRLQAAQTDGNTALVTKLRGQLDVVNKSLADGIDKAEAYWKQFDTPEARAAITNLEALRAGIGRTNQDITLTNLQSPVDQLGARRSAGLDQVQALRDEGQTRAAAALREQVVGLDKDLLKAIDDLIAFWSASSRPEAAATVASLQNMRVADRQHASGVPHHCGRHPAGVRGRSRQCVRPVRTIGRRG
jgi:hypothetical protein